METILADGQCLFSVYVITETGQGPQVIDALKSWKQEVRKNGFDVNSVKRLCDKVHTVPGVKCVSPAGPRSALPLALRIACGLTGRKGVFASHIGSGAASGAISAGFRDWNIEIHVLQKLEGDMPISFMVIDPNEPSKHTSVNLHPLTRTRYRHRSVYPDQLLDETDAMLQNRVNQGILESAEKMREAGKINSLRIHGYSRHVRFDDFKPMLPLVDHLVVDSGHNSLRDTAQALGLNPPRGWPDAGTLDPTFLQRMARALDAIAGCPLLHAYVITGRDTLHLLGLAGHASITLRPIIPEGTLCDLKTTSRVHGALLAAILLNKSEFDIDPASRQPKSEKGLEKLANWTFRAAHHGILNIPWQWPGEDFAPEHMKILV